MRRLLALTFLLAPAAPAHAAVRIGGDGDVHALAVSRGAALAVVESGDPAEPLSLVRSTGAGVSDLGGFGERGAEFPALAVDAEGRPLVSWSRPVSGGAAVTVVRAPAGRSQVFGEPFPEIFATGPGRLTASVDGDPVVAYPDRDGNAVVATLSGGRDRAAARPAPHALTSTAPYRRHLPLDVAMTPDGPLVLDLIQERGRSELRVLGPGAPASAILSVRALRHFPARMAVDDDRIVVGYLSRGRVHVAIARLGRSWSRRKLRGRGGDGAPAPVLVDGELHVAYAQRSGRQRELFLASPWGTRRLTRTPGHERDPVAAVGPDGDAYVAWTRREPRRGRTTAWLQRVE